MGGLSLWHWLIVLLIVALIFGTKRLTGGANDIGNEVKEFKKGMRDEDKHDAPPEALPPPVLRPVAPTIHPTTPQAPEAAPRPRPLRPPPRPAHPPPVRAPGPR